MLSAVSIRITGVVQGVGFRPFVYGLAKQYRVTGWVANDDSGVIVEAEGSQASLDGFVAALTGNPPPLAVIDGLSINPLQPRGYNRFDIKTSHDGPHKTALISPDVATCSSCLEELLNPDDRRYRYPFINCTNCGPRYTIIRDTPYDRQATTMQGFVMCPACRHEYDDPGDRRFHAQPNACPVCGPTYRLLDRNGEQVRQGQEEQDVFMAAKRLIAQGAILAVKGIGGYHLAVNAFDSVAVELLRQQKVREDKPFAIMAGSLAAVKAQCNVTAAEEKLLVSAARPIVLLGKAPGYSLAEAIAPGNPYVGVMLPYNPAHYLLLAAGDLYVMTSGNISDEPIAYRDDDAIDRLKNIADYFLVHDREIYSQADDSVVRTAFDKPYVIRRSRGYVPMPVILACKQPPVLAVGGELKNTFCLTRGRQAFLSAHTGDLENMLTYQSYVAAIEHFKKLLNVSPAVVAYDLHPEYLSTQYAATLPLPGIAVQHHHAHIAAVMAEHHLAEAVIGLAFDGTGYGPDGTLWGGEFLVADLSGYRRLGHIACLPLPGGTKAVKEPWRLALWLLNDLYGQEFVNLAMPFVQQLPPGWQMILEAADKGINTPLSSGMGRLFDAAAALLGIRQHINYEGQAAIELELAAQGAIGRVQPYTIRETGGVWVLDFKPLFDAICRALCRGAAAGQLAADFQSTLAAAACEVTVKISNATGIRKVALSGGVFQNMTLLTRIVGMFSEHQLDIYLHRQVPANDGGLSLGQAIVAGYKSW